MKKEFVKYYIIVFVIIIVVAYFVGNRKGRLKFLAENKDEKQNQSDLDEYGVSLSNINKSRLTLNENHYYSLADKIQKAFGIFDDEQAIYEAFEKLSNIDDLLMLIYVYGKRYITLTPTFGQPAWKWITKFNLKDSLTRKLSKNEIQEINNILRRKGINYSF